MRADMLFHLVAWALLCGCCGYVSAAVAVTHERWMWLALAAVTAGLALCSSVISRLLTPQRRPRLLLWRRPTFTAPKGILRRSRRP